MLFSMREKYEWNCVLVFTFLQESTIVSSCCILQELWWAPRCEQMGSLRNAFCHMFLIGSLLSLNGIINSWSSAQFIVLVAMCQLVVVFYPNPFHSFLPFAASESSSLIWVHLQIWDGHIYSDEFTDSLQVDFMNQLLAFILTLENVTGNLSRNFFTFASTLPWDSNMKWWKVNVSGHWCA